MEKIAALIDKLQELKSKGAALSDLAYYTQLLYAELMCAKGNLESEKTPGRKKVAVIMPGYQSVSAVEEPAPKVAEKTDEQVYTKAVEPVAAEKEPLTAPEPKAEPVMQAETYPGPDQQEAYAPKTLFDQVAENAYAYKRPVNTTSNNKELNEVIADHKPSLNDKLKTEKIELAAKLNGSTSINDLSKAIDINDKFLFINELFRGDRNMYDRSIKTINECSNLETAEYWIERELKIKLGWQEKDAAVQQFYQLIKKRFIAA